MAVARGGSGRLTRALDLTSQIFQCDGVFLRFARGHHTKIGFSHGSMPSGSSRNAIRIPGPTNPACVLPPLDTALQPTRFADKAAAFERWLAACTGIELSLPMPSTLSCSLWEPSPRRSPSPWASALRSARAHEAAALACTSPNDDLAILADRADAGHCRSNHAHDAALLGDKLVLFAVGGVFFGVPLQASFALMSLIQRRLIAVLSRGAARAGSAAVPYLSRR
jgi:hypothetical protein